MMLIMLILKLKKNFDEDALDYYTSLSNFTKY